MERVRRYAVLYFAVQAAAVSGWWLLLATRPALRPLFLVLGSPEAVLLAFWLPDLLLIVAGSLLGCWLCLRRHSLAPAALWVVTGGVAYASLYCLALSWLTDTAWLGVVLMLPSMLISLSFSLALTPAAAPFFRQARPAGSSWNLAKTALQILLFWSTLFFVVPSAIMHAEERLGIDRFHFPGQVPLAAALFVLLGALNLWTGFTMSTSGQGTPLPLDSPRRLVTAGPYAYVRNPMAMASLGQGASVALGLGSPMVGAYVLLGACIWECIARPMEEESLLRHFGAGFEAYRREVRCWWPRLTPYRRSELLQRGDEFAEPDGAISAER